MSARLDPTLLAAYADGQLSAEESAEVERQLAESPEDSRTIESLREMNADLASAFAAPLRDPLPPSLSKSLAGARGTRRVPVSWQVAAGSALAACIALAAGYLAGGAWSAADPALMAGEVARSSALHELLETGGDADATSLRNGTATLSTTFIDGRREPCRDLEWTGETAASSTWAIACRRGERWVVEVAVSQPAAGAEERDAYVTAAGAAENVRAAALDALQAGPVLGPDEVDLLLSSDWSPR